MKAVAAALVLIAGAAVVLWYGNTLNSWVLGGLIGGLAALLLSIPISLMVFSYLSKRHDERLQAEEQDAHMLDEDDYEYEQLSPRSVRRAREVEGYVITDEPSARWRDKELYAPQTPRALPPPQRQTTRNAERLPSLQQGTHAPVQKTQQDKTKAKETTVLRSTTKKIGGSGTPAFEPTSSISYHRSEALRQARLEATQQQEDDVEVLPTNNPKRSVIVRPSQSLAKQGNQGTSVVPPRPTRQQPPPVIRQSRQRRVVDSAVPRNGSQTLPNGTEPIRRLEPNTDSIAEAYSQTGPLSRRGSQGGRNSDTTQEHEQRSAADSTTGSVNRPLVRRAPYMYSDDPLRQELAQHLEAPTVRRSSRFDEDDENE